MADVAPSAETASANPGQPARPAQNGPGTPAQTFGLEEVKRIVEEATRPLHAELRRVKESVSPNPKPESQAERTLTQRIQDLEARELRLAEKGRIQALKDAAIQAGVDPSRVDIFADHVLARQGQRIKAQDDQIIWTDELDQPKSLSDLAASVLKGPQGDMFRPAAPVPAARGLRPNGRVATPRSYTDIPQAERLKMTLEQRMALAKESAGLG